MPKVATRVDAGSVLAALRMPSAVDDVDAQILDAAGRLLFDEGLAAVEVDRVALAAGVGRSTVYRRFDGRNALLAATVAHEARRLLGALAAAVDPRDNLVDQVVCAFSTGLAVARETGLSGLVRDEPLLLRLLTVEAGPVVAVARAELVALAAVALPSLPAAAVDRTADLLVRLAISLVVTPDPAFEDESTVRAMVTLLLRGA